MWRLINEAMKVEHAIVDMHMQGVSTRNVTEITREVCCLEMTPVLVSRATAALEEQLEDWRKLPSSRITICYLTPGTRGCVTGAQ